MAHTAQITVANNHGSISLRQFRTVYFEFDHAALVTAKRSRADGADLRMYYVNEGAPINCWVDPQRVNTTTARVFFALQNDIGFGDDDDEFYLAWGNLDRQPVRDERLAFSQMHNWQGDGMVGIPTGTVDYDDLILDDAVRGRSPFLLFDDQRKRYNTTTKKFDDVVVGGVGDSQTYGASATAVYGDPATGGRGLFFNGTQTAVFALLENDTDWTTCKRMRCYMYSDPTWNVPVCGMGTEETITNLMIGGPFSGANVWIINYDPGAVTVAGPTLAWSNGVFHETIFTFDPETTPGTNKYRLQCPTLGVDLSYSDASPFQHDPRFACFLNAAVGASASTFYGLRDWSLEVWEGVHDDADVAVTATIPDLSLPSAPGFPLVTQYRFGPHPSISYPQFNVSGSSKSRPDAGIETHSLVWNEMDPEDFWELQALWRANYGGCAEVEFDAPHEAGGDLQYVFVPGSLQSDRRGANSYGATVQIERSRIQS